MSLRLVANGRRRRWLAVGLYAFAGVRVALYCSVFPFFANVDEAYHFDLIWKYSRLEWSRSEGSERFASDASRYFVYFASPEFLYRPDDFPGHRYPAPFWTLPREKQIPVLATQVEVDNPEQHAPPLYYALAGAWLKVGEWSGLREGALLYWTRFLNVPIFLAMVGLAFHVGAQFFAHRPGLRWGLPLLVAFFPQDAFYALNSDVLTPIPSALAFILACRLLTGRGRGAPLHAALGALSGASFLVKISNVPALIWTGCVLLSALRRARSPALRRSSLVDAALLAGVAFAPVALWALFNHADLGDWTGTRRKIEMMGWTFKPISEVLPHPIGTWDGLRHFITTLLATFWTGEFTWAAQRVALRSMDQIYALSTIGFLSLAAVFSLRGARAAAEHRVVAIGLLGIATAVAYLGVLSTLFDFHDCFYPSRENPFFHSGRLLLCVMLPILLGYAYGLDELLGLFAERRLTVPILVLFGVATTIVDAYLHLPILGSPYNLWHLPARSVFG